MKFNKKILMISAATLMLVSPVTSLANANTVSAASVKKVSYAKQTTVTVKKKTPQLFMATGGRALTTGKYYKKGQKLTVDQLGGMNILANSSPDAYHIKGTDYYVWAKDVKAKHALQDIDYTSRGLTTVRTNESKAPLYSFDAEKSTPAGYAFMKGTDFKVNGAMYLYNAKTDKSELYYHLTNHYHTMANLKTSPDFPNRFNAELVNTGDAFVKASDVNFFSGKKLKPINTAASAKDGSKIAILENQEADLKNLLGKVDSVKNSVKYKLSSSLKRDNYDLAVRDAQTQVNSRKLMSTAEAQYLIWSLKTYESELDGAKVKVGNMNKLTSNEKLAIGLLVISVYGKNTDKESLYGYAKFNKGNDKTFTLTIEDMHNQNKVVSTKTMKTSDFAQKR
ncbi:serine protease [Lactobacillus kitasatonis]|uniref:serine protease n=1 Tax=Lactobacillus kitasatonis TaxID=237446 RepID=UPI0026F2C26D|nr:serine protease [Lactobacillus kitasatonis]